MDKRVHRCANIWMHACVTCVCVHGCQGAWVHRCMGTCVKLHGCISACGVGVRGCRGAWPHEAPRGSTKARGAPPRGPGGAPHSRFTRVGGINLRKIKKTGKIRIGKGGLGQTPQVITTKPRGAPPRGPGGAPHSRFTRMGGHTPRKNRKNFKIRIGKGDLGQTPMASYDHKTQGGTPQRPRGGSPLHHHQLQGGTPQRSRGGPPLQIHQSGRQARKPRIVHIYKLSA